jgi:uncharacterized protein YihD (DUF1040 family)
LPFLKEVKVLGAQLLGLNATRNVKKQIIDKGLNSLSEDLIPPNYENGGANYFERFKVVMAEHVPAEKLKDYFIAQSYTDDVMAYQLELQSSNKLRFTINGAFHSDFNDGFVTRLEKRSSVKTVTLKIVDSESLDEDMKKELIEGSSAYGVYADYILFAK